MRRVAPTKELIGIDVECFSIGPGTIIFPNHLSLSLSFTLSPLFSNFYFFTSPSISHSPSPSHSKFHDDLKPCRVSLVNSDYECILDLIIAPDPAEIIFSPLTLFHGLSEEKIREGVTFEAAREVVLQVVKNAVLVGHRIQGDIEWMKLKEGEDFISSLDVCDLLSSYNAKYRNRNYFSLAQEVGVLLPSSPVNPHSPFEDAALALRLYQDCCIPSARLMRSQNALKDARSKKIRAMVPSPFLLIQILSFLTRYQLLTLKCLQNLKEKEEMYKKFFAANRYGKLGTENTSLASSLHSFLMIGSSKLLHWVLSLSLRSTLVRRSNSTFVRF